MRLTSLATALVTTVLVACAKDKAAIIDSTRSADSVTAAGARSTTSPTAPWTDANIIAVMDELNVIDSAGGNLASTKGTNADVRTFGVAMMNDHHRLRNAGQDVAREIAVTPTPPANDSFPAKGKVMADSMTSMPKGPAWDKTYIAKEVAVHQQVLGIIDSLTPRAQASALKTGLKQARSAVEAHLKRAQEIQGKLQ